MNKKWLKGEVREYEPAGGGCCYCVNPKIKCRFKRRPTMKKRTKLPPPEFFRYQQFYNDTNDIDKSVCCKCSKLISGGIHDLGLDLIYCFGCADEDGVKEEGDKV